jgi:hypothetical protein
MQKTKREMKRRFSPSSILMKVIPLRSESCFVFLIVTEPSDEEEEEEEEEDTSSIPRVSGERNSMLTVGYKGDRSYVVRGNNIGVFSHTGDNQVKYFATISKISTTKGKEFKPREVVSLLHIG